MFVRKIFYRLPRNLSLPWMLAGIFSLFLLLLGALYLLDIHRELVVLFQWVERQGVWAGIIFVGVMALVVVLLLPGVFFTTGAGFVFGLVEGTVYVVLGSTLGAALAFLLARYLFGADAKSYILAHQKLNAFGEEARKHDFKVVLLTRLIPFFPGKLSNYFFGLTSFRFNRYVVASLLGFVPFSLHNVYLGSLAADLATLGAGEVQRTPIQWFFYGLGFVAVVVAVVFFNRIAQRSLAQYRASGSAGEETPKP